LLQNERIYFSSLNLIVALQQTTILEHQIF